MESILAILAEYGLVSTILVVAIMITLVPIKSYITTNKPTKKPEPSPDRRKLDLNNHEFFNNLEFKLTIDLPIETFSPEENRNIMYRDIMIYLFTSYHRNMLSFVNNISETWTSEQWATNLNRVHYTIVQEFKEECIRNSVPEIAVILFMSWYNPYVSRIHQYITYISRVPDTTVIGKTRFFLLVLELILATLTADAQRAKKLNGELDGLEYKGLTL